MKRRPSVWWFVIGGVLLVAGIGLGVTLGVVSVSRVTATDGTFAADGAAHRLTVPTGKERMVFAAADSAIPACAFTDAHGHPLALRGVFGTATVTTGGRTWAAFGTLDGSDTARVTAHCGPGSDDGATQVRVGAPITIKGLGGAIIAAFAAFLGLGGAGFLVLLVTTILWITRRQPEPAPS